MYQVHLISIDNAIAWPSRPGRCAGTPGTNEEPKRLFNTRIQTRSPKRGQNRRVTTEGIRNSFARARSCNGVALNGTIVLLGMRVAVTVAVTSILDALRVDTGSRTLRGASQGIPVATLVVDVFEVECMDVSWEVPGAREVLDSNSRSRVV